MRMGVLDIGSNTGHLLVVDAHRGAAPLPAYSQKEALRLAEHLDSDGAVDSTGVDALVKFVREAKLIAEDKGCETIRAFATSAVRDAANADRVLDVVQEETDVELHVLPGGDEARLTFLAVRRWFGWSSGHMLVFDIGGGSLEIAAGNDEVPDVAQSLQLGAARLSREWFDDSPVDQDRVRELRKYVRAEVARDAGDVLRMGPPDHAIATSKTFRSLARICGAAGSKEGAYAKRVLPRDELATRLPELTAMTPKQIAKLPGVGSTRAHQIAAGAVVADAVLDLFDLPELEVCPWALREGVILQWLDLM
ncbi:MAG TPA: Ppx/GppA family phosphatase [Nocardioidaceae bacterium]|nr:Ppx/GppA family phosphatase [Nocardioidaceae bacterium]